MSAACKCTSTRFRKTPSFCKATWPLPSLSPQGTWDISVDCPAPCRYLICVTIASIFFTAAIYLCLARVVVVFGEKLSFLRPRTYTILFIIW